MLRSSFFARKVAIAQGAITHIGVQNVFHGVVVRLNKVRLDGSKGLRQPRLPESPSLSLYTRPPRRWLAAPHQRRDDGLHNVELAPA